MEMTFVLVGGALIFGAVITVFALVVDWRERYYSEQSQ